MTKQIIKHLSSKDLVLERHKEFYDIILKGDDLFN